MARLLSAAATATPDGAAVLFAPSAALADVVVGYQYREFRVPAGSLVRPVGATTNTMLVLSLRDPHYAYEYATGAVRRLPSAMLVGPQSRRVADLRFAGSHQTLAISFQPAGLTRLFGLPACEVADTAEDAARLFGPAVDDLMRKLRQLQWLQAGPGDFAKAADGFLTERLSQLVAPQPVHLAALALHRSHGATDIDRLARETGHSIRHFNRAFARQLGMSPKRFAMVARLAYALRIKQARPQSTWADISQLAGYYDQNHMVKDFKSLVGVAPTAYLRVIAGTPMPLRPFPDMA